jgi:hypothetical protein
MSNELSFDLEDVVAVFPFFQAARVLFLKSLKKQNSFRYNQLLKTTAAYATDRSILFKFITSDEFDDTFLKEKETHIINEIEAIDTNVVENISNENLSQNEDFIDDVPIENEEYINAKLEELFGLHQIVSPSNVEKDFVKKETEKDFFELLQENKSSETQKEDPVISESNTDFFKQNIPENNISDENNVNIEVTKDFMSRFENEIQEENEIKTELEKEGVIENSEHIPFSNAIQDLENKEDSKQNIEILNQQNEIDIETPSISKFNDFDKKPLIDESIEKDIFHDIDISDESEIDEITNRFLKLLEDENKNTEKINQKPDTSFFDEIKSNKIDDSKTKVDEKVQENFETEIPKDVISENELNIPAFLNYNQKEDIEESIEKINQKPETSIFDEIQSEIMDNSKTKVDEKVQENFETEIPKDVISENDLNIPAFLNYNQKEDIETFVNKIIPVEKDLSQENTINVEEIYQVEKVHKVEEIFEIEENKKDETIDIIGGFEKIGEVTEEKDEIVFELFPHEIDEEPIQKVEKPNEEIKISLDEDFSPPVQFFKNDTHSFADWLKISSFKPIDRSVEPTKKISLEDKLDLIEEFIVKNPKIEPVKDTSSKELPKIQLTDSEEIMTETLARVYVLQHKYAEAINAYQILSLKFPEKSSFFANQIEQIEVLKSNNFNK